MTSRSMKPLFRLGMALLIAALSFSCSTVPPFRSDVPATWLEGKDLPVNITFSAGRTLDAVQRLTLIYRMGDGAERLLDMTRVLEKASAVIPGSSLTQGKLSYYLRVDDGKKVDKSRKMTVRILSRAEGLELAKRALRARIDWNPEPAPCDFLDADFPLSVGGAASGTTVRFFVRKNGLPWELRQAALLGGKADLTLSPEQMAAGYRSFYAEVSEPNLDFGQVTVSLPEGGAGSPSVIDPVTADEARALLARDLSLAVKAQADKEASVLYDYGLSFSYAPSSSYYVRTLLQGEPRMDLEARLPGSAAWATLALASDGSGSWNATIPAGGMAAGELDWALQLSADAKVLGEVTASYPQGGKAKPLAVDVSSADRSLQRLQRELASSFSVDLPKELSPLDDATLRASFSLPAGSWLARKADAGSVRLAARLRRGGSFEFRTREFQKDWSGWYLPLSSKDLRSGVDGFSVDLSVDSGTAAGRVSATVPGGFKAGYDLRVLTLAELADRRAVSWRLELARTFAPPRSLAGGSDATFLVPLDVDCVSAVIRYQTAASKAIVERPLQRTKGGWLAVIPGADLIAGGFSYSFAFQARDPQIGIVAFSYPAGGDSSPLSATVTAPAQ